MTKNKSKQKQNSIIFTNNDIIKLAVNYWRLEKYIGGLSLNKHHAEYALRHLKEIFDNYQIEIIDKHGSEYDAGFPFEVLHSYLNNTTREIQAIVVETIEPAVFIKEKLVHRGQVVLGTISDFEGEKDEEVN